MSFYEMINKYSHFDFKTFYDSLTPNDILRIISKRKLDELDYLALLSPIAEDYLESMAQKANENTLKYFGKAIVLYTPLYLSNYCENKCAYCGFNTENKIKRKKLTLEEIEIEAQKISATGLRHILILTGSSRAKSPVSYILKAVNILKKYFDSISMEVYPMTEMEYKQLIDAGVDSLSIYQEVYDEKIYDNVHLAGPKKNYLFRLNAAERACLSKIRNVCVGALLGLNDWRKEFFITGLHAKYLQDLYPDVDISVAFPRIRAHIGNFTNIHHVTDKNVVQMLIALRIFIPRTGAVFTTRESSKFKDNLLPLGVTKISAGVTTKVGGHTSNDNEDAQFDISDSRSVEEVKNDLIKLGYQPVFKDWMLV